MDVVQDVDHSAGLEFVVDGDEDAQDRGQEDDDDGMKVLI